MQNAEKVRSLLKDLREARQSKSRDGLSQIDNSELSVCIFYYHCYYAKNWVSLVAEPMLNGDQRNQTLFRESHGCLYSTEGPA